MSSSLHVNFFATIERNKANAKPGARPGGVWFAKDQASLDRLVAFSKGVQLDYEKAAVTTGYQWCGSFIAAHYGMTGDFEFLSKKNAGKKKGAVSKADGNMYLASTDKSYDFFNYAGEWNGAYIRDPAVAESASVAECYKPIRMYHAANGGERDWLPIDEWKSNPMAVAKPGMVLFVHKTQKYKNGAHMIMVDYVEADGKGGWIVHTVEGNAPGAKSAPGKYTIGADGKSEIVAVARPSASDFDSSISMCDADIYTRKLKAEEGQ